MINTRVLKKRDNVIHINTENKITEISDRINYELVWGVVSALFIINTDAGPVVPLVQRTKDTSNPLKWALLPSGGIDSVEELRVPNRAMEREIYEELHLFHNDEYIYPLSFHHEDSEVIIVDDFEGKKYHAYGEFFEWNKVLFLIATFVSDRVFELEKFCVFDGEKREEDYLHRDVALIPYNTRLEGIVTPLASYKYGKHNEKLDIDLEGYQTPTLEYLRKKWKNESG